MKIKHLLLVCGITAFFAGCQNENEPSLPAEQPSKSGTFRIVIEGENTESTPTRGTITFPGGSASGAGLYDGTAQAVVSATPDAGYEINYFYGGPDSEPRKYDITNNGGVSTFKVDINGQDHTFHVGFQRKTGRLNIIAGAGGSVTPSGQQTYNQEEPVSIKATANSGYEFTGWTVSGDVSIDNPSSNNAKATLHGSSGTITANFQQSGPTVEYYTYTFYATGSPGLWQEIYVNNEYIGDATTNGESLEIRVKERDIISTKGCGDRFDSWWTTKGDIRQFQTRENITLYAGDYPDGMGFCARYK